MRKRPLSATVEGPGFVTGEADIGEKVLAATWLSGAASHVLAIASPGEWQSSAILSRIDELGAGGLFGARRPFAKFHRCRAVALSGHWRFALVHLLGWPRS